MRISLLILFLGLLISCQRFDQDEVDNLNGGKIEVIGHAGSGFQLYTNMFPSNSWGSITRAVDGLNVDGVEVDVQITSDDQLVLYHDQQLQTLTDCLGCILDLPANEVKKCRYNKDYAVNVWEDEKVVLLDAVLARYAAYSNPPKFYLDVKGGSFCGEQPNLDVIAEKLIEQIDKHQGLDWITVESTNTDLLRRIRDLEPNITLMLDSGDPEVAISTAVDEGWEGIVIHKDNISKDQVKKAHDNGLHVHLFGVVERAGTISALEKHPDGVQTDNIELLQEILNQ